MLLIEKGIKILKSLGSNFNSPLGGLPVSHSHMASCSSKQQSWEKSKAGNIAIQNRIKNPKTPNPNTRNYFSEDLLQHVIRYTAGSSILHYVIILFLLSMQYSSVSIALLTGAAIDQIDCTDLSITHYTWLIETFTRSELKLAQNPVGRSFHHHHVTPGLRFGTIIKIPSLALISSRNKGNWPSQRKLQKQAVWLINGDNNTK